MFSQVLVPCSWIFGVSLNVPAFLSYVYVKEVGGCVYLLTEEWMGKLLSMSWFIFLGFLPVVVMTALYSRVVYALWFKSSDNAGNNSQQVGKILPYEYSCFSLLLAARDVSPGGTCAPQRQKFHTDDVKSVGNMVRNSNWSLSLIHI